MDISFSEDAEGRKLNFLNLSTDTPNTVTAKPPKYDSDAVTVKMFDARFGAQISSGGNRNLSITRVVVPRGKQRQQRPPKRQRYSEDDVKSSIKNKNTKLDQGTYDSTMSKFSSLSSKPKAPHSPIMSKSKTKTKTKFKLKINSILNQAVDIAKGAAVTASSAIDLGPGAMQVKEPESGPEPEQEPESWPKKLTPVFLKNIDGHTLVINVDLSGTFGDFKIRIEERTGIPVYQQRLLSGGRQPEDQETLADCNIVRESTVHLVLRLCGS